MGTTDLRASIKARLDRLEARSDNRGPLCICSGQYNIVMVKASTILAGNKPETVCQRCGKAILLIVVVASREQVAQLAELEGKS
jgi:hypothetical protein